MKFFNSQYPNMTIRGNGINVKFIDGVFETSDSKTIQLLKDAGLSNETDEKKPVKNISK